MSRFSLFLALLLVLPTVAHCATPDGHAVYQSHCASCHDNPAATNAPSKSALEILSRASIVLSLQSGSMKDQGKSLTAEEKRAVADFLTPSDETKRHFALASNPRASSGFYGNGMLGRALGLKEDWGITLGGLIHLDGDWLTSGGLKPNAITGNFLLGVNLSVDTEKALHIPGGQFGIEFIEFQGADTNGQAGTVQGYNNLTGGPPFGRIELLQMWWHQMLFNNRLMFKVGKLNGAAEFNTVTAPVPVSDPKMLDGSISDLTFAPSGLNPTMDNRLPAYYNTAYGGLVAFEPTKSFYVQYGIFDGNGARNVQTGLHVLPNINAYKFHIAEASYAWRLGSQGKPGRFAAGGWHQTGKLSTPSPSITQDGDSGFYAFGAQRLWYERPGHDSAGLESFYQYGYTNSRAAAATRYGGGGVSAVSLIHARPSDSFGVGVAWSRLNHTPGSEFRHDEFMWQAYYKAVLIPWKLAALVAYSSIPSPGAQQNIPWANALTARLIILF